MEGITPLLITYFAPTSKPRWRYRNKVSGGIKSIKLSDRKVVINRIGLGGVMERKWLLLVAIYNIQKDLFTLNFTEITLQQIDIWSYHILKTLYCDDFYARTRVDGVQSGIIMKLWTFLCEFCSFAYTWRIDETRWI